MEGAWQSDLGPLEPLVMIFIMITDLDGDDEVSIMMKIILAAHLRGSKTKVPLIS